MSVFHIIFGLFLLFLGKELFWVSIGIIGFWVGINFATSLVSQSEGLMVFIFALVLGILGAVFALAFQWFTILLVGFLGGGYFLVNILSFMVGQTLFSRELFLFGGIVGLLLMFIAFDGALIVISSLLGAMFIIESLNVSESLRPILFIGSVTLGILVQYLSIQAINEEKRI